MLTIYVLFRMDIADNMATLLEAYIDKEDAMAELKALERRAKKGRRKVWNYFIEECPLIENKQLRSENERLLEKFFKEEKKENG